MITNFTVQPLGGLGPQIGQSIARLGDTIAQNRQREEMKAQQEAQRNLLSRAYSGDASAIPELFASNPQLGLAMEERLNQQAQAQNEKQQLITRQNTQNVLRNALSRTGQDRIDYLNQVSADPNMSMVSVDDELLGLPEAEQTALLNMAAYQYLGEDWFNNFLAAGERQNPTSLQKEYQQAVDQGFEGTLIDYQKALSNDPTQDLEMLKLRAQIAGIEQQNQSRKEDRAMREKMKETKQKTLVSGIDSILEEVDKAVAQADQFMATGIGGALTSGIPETPSYNLKRRIDTIQANLGFDKLQQMRDASPTGGALGAVSERELNLLTSTISNLDPNQGDEVLIENLKKIRRHYNNWKQTLTGENPYSGLIGVQSPTLGRPVYHEDIIKALDRGYTMEEIKQRLQING